MALVICTWLWGNKYSLNDVAKLHGGVRRNLRQPFRFVVVTDQVDSPEVRSGKGGPMEFRPIDIEDLYLLRVKGCFVRLRMFSPEWQSRMGVTDRLVCMDLDSVVTGGLDPVFDRPEKFVIMQGGNASNPCPYNGAMMMLRPGAHPEVWEDFSLEKARQIPFFEFPDDQGWIAYKVPGAAAWKCGLGSSVFVFRKPGWPSYDVKMRRSIVDALPTGARVVTFSGGRSPAQYEELPWVRKHWTA